MTVRRQTFSPSARQVEKTKKINEDIRYIQGFPITAGAGATVPQKLTLNSAGKKFLGISIIPATLTTDISNCQISVAVNNNNLLVDAAAQNANPNFVQGMLFLPIPQPLTGTDIINLSVKNNSGAPVSIIANVWYVPQI